MNTIIPGEIPHNRLHQLLLGAIGPRPIAFASTVDADGNPNLSPFSFFNVFGVNPTTLIFSPSRRGRDNTTKDTYENVKMVPEVVINVVTFDIVNQVSLASTEYARGIDEFSKAGFTKIPSVKVRPPRVKESPVQIECLVRQIIETGDGGGAANLVICEVQVMHIDETVLADDGLIDQQKIRLVGRMGRDWYCRAFGDGIFMVEKPLQKMGIGIDALPEAIRFSPDLTGNELGRLGNLERLPSPDEVGAMKQHPDVFNILNSSGNPKTALIGYSRQLIEEGRTFEALTVLLI
jgi:flavin reductase (DIM6/NTAB) family NADH-FMN oxidoreductase RutF